MRKIGKILSFVLAVAVILTSFGMSVYAQVEGFDKTLLTPTTTAGTNIAAWGNYLYVSSGRGIDIVDVRTGESLVAWSTASIKAAISTTASSFVPSQISVNEKYIAVTSTTVNEKAYIAVFENPGVYTEQLPDLCATLGYFNIPVTQLDGDNLIVFDLTADGTVNNSYITIDENTTLVWKINLSCSEDFARNTAKLTQVGLRSMIEGGYSSYIEMGTYEYLWKQIDIKNGKAYAVTYNNTNYVPYKALILHSIDIETMTDNKMTVEDGHISGLLAVVEGSVTMGDLSDAVVFLATDESKSMTAQSIGLAQFYVESIDEETAYLYFSQSGFNKVGDIASAAEIQTGEAELKITVAGETYDFEYFSNDNVYERGTVSAKDGYAYLASNMTESNLNRLWEVREADGEVILNEVLYAYGNASNANNRNGWQTSVITGDRLVGFVSNVNYRVATIDISDPENITVNAADTVYIENLPIMHSGNQYAKAAVLSDRIYYPLADGSGAGVLKTGDSYFSANVKYEETSYPVIIYGECSIAEEVCVTIGENTYTIPVQMGIYTCPIYSIEPGTYTAEVAAGSESETVEFTVNVPEKIIVEDIRIESQIEMDVTNNSGTTVLNVIVASYDENGVMKQGTSKKFIAPAGRAYTFKNAVLSVPDGGYIKIFILDGEEPLCAPIKIIDGVGEPEEDTVIVGYNPQTQLSADANLADEIVTISGESIVGNRVMLKITAGDKVVLYDQLSCNENGEFTYSYNFSDDNYEGIYIVTATAGNAASVTAEFASVAGEVVDDVFEKIDGMDGEQLLIYFGNNPDDAEILGINLSNSDFVSFDNDTKVTVMDAVAQRINDGYRTGIATTFLEAIELAKEEQENDNVPPEDDNESDDDDDESGSFGGGGNGSGSGGSKVAIEENIVNPYTPITPVDLFTDLGGVLWAKESINSLATAGIVDGVGNKMFNPNGIVTREQFIKMLVLGFKFSAETDEMNFPDVKTSDWYYDYVKIASATGITNGDEYGNFGAGKALSREDAAVFVKRTVEVLGKTLPQNAQGVEYADSADIAEYAKGAVALMQTSGVMNGTDGGTFSPKGSCTRAMAAKIIYELLAAVK